MGFFSSLFGDAAAAPIKALTDGLDKLFTSDDERLTKQELLERTRQIPALAQVELNKTEAQHRSIFVAGWRPFIGWVCGLALFNEFLLNPWLVWIFQRPAPALDTRLLFDLVLAMLGLGAMRTVEKLKGKTK